MTFYQKKLFVSVLILGLSSVIAQVVFLREIIISFYGNEFFWGVVLASWLCWVALGCKIFEVLLAKTKKEFSVLRWLHLLTPFFLLGEIFLLRWTKTWLAMPGEIPNLSSTVLAAFFFPLPVCLILGGWWTIVTCLIGRGKKELAGWLTNKAYLLEIIGFAVGGVLFSFLLIGLNEILVGWLLLLLNLAMVFYLSIKQKRAVFWKITAGILSLFFFISMFGGLPYRLNQASQGFRFKGQELLESVNSPFGNIAVTKIESAASEPQYNFYESGLLLGATEDYYFNEIFVHLSLLSHPSPQKVLLIGGGITGAVSEILKHPISQVYYLELDPKLIDTAKKYLSKETKKDLHDKKVTILNLDGRYFLEKTKELFDVILIHLPDPSTALINRFYTKEFFQKAKEKLKPEGILSTYLTYSPSAPNKDLENLNVSLQKTLKSVFSQVIMLPEETNFFLASQDGQIETEPDIIAGRFKQREIETKFFNQQYIVYRFSSERISQALDLFSKNQAAKINRDQKPAAYFYNISFWLSHFQPGASKFFQKISQHFLWIIIGLLLLVTLIFIKKRKKALFAALSAATAGFSLITLQMVIIFTYQIIIGYLYYRIALLLACFMAGMALGIFSVNKKVLKKKANLSSLAKTHLSLAAWSLILVGLFWLLPKFEDVFFKEVFLLGSSVLAGFLGALIFPLANSFYLSLQQDPSKKTSTIYSADLLGSCLGGVVPAFILIPVFGLSFSLVLLGFVNGWLVCLFFVAKDFSGEDV